MDFRGDDRAQSMQIGAVILFGFLVIAMAGYQAQVVPAENKQVEFRHSEQIQDQLGALRNSIIGTGIGGQAAPVSIDLGARYPDRTFFVNPPPVTGSLRTVPFERPVWINGTELDGKGAAEAWDAAENFSSRALVYRANYRVMDQQPTQRLAHGLLYTQYADANVTRTDQPLISGNRITLVTLNGSLSKSGLGSATIDPTRLSVSTTETTLRPDGTPTIFLPAKNGSVWKRALEAQIDPDAEVGKDNQFVTDVSTVSGGVLIELEPATYRLRLAKVGVGHGTVDPTASYLEVVNGPGGSITDAGTVDVTVAVRDRFTNPVAGRRVNVSGPGLPSNVTTDADGTATVTYDPGDVTATQSVAINFSLGDATTVDDASPGEEQVTFDVTDADAVGSGPGDKAYTLRWRDPSGQSGVTCNSDGTSCTWDAGVSSSLSLVVETAPTVQDLNGQFAVSNDLIASISPSEFTTNETGQATATLEANKNGTLNVYTTGGSDSDVIEITVTGITDNDPGFAFEDTNNNGEWDSGTDIQLADSEVTDGKYNAGNNGLVIPDSVNGGQIQAGSIEFKGRGIRIGTDLTATTGQITIDGKQSGVDVSHITIDNSQASSQKISLVGSGDIDATGSTIRSSGQTTIDAGGNLDITGATLTTTGSYQSISLTADGSVTGASSATTVRTEGEITITAGSTMDLSGATIETTGNSQSTTLKSTGDMTLVGTDILGVGYADMTADLGNNQYTLDVTDARVVDDSGNPTLVYDPNGITVVGENQMESGSVSPN